jgi:hypothetical protein
VCIWGIIICGRGCNYPNQSWDLCSSGASCVTLLHLLLSFFFAAAASARIYTHSSLDPLPKHNENEREEIGTRKQRGSSPTHSLSLRVYLSKRAQGMKGPDKICVLCSFYSSSFSHTHIACFRFHCYWTIANRDLYRVIAKDFKLKPQGWCAAVGETKQRLRAESEWERRRMNKSGNSFWRGGFHAKSLIYKQISLAGNYSKCKHTRIARAVASLFVSRVCFAFAAFSILLLPGPIQSNYTLSRSLQTLINAQHC